MIKLNTTFLLCCILFVGNINGQIMITNVTTKEDYVSNQIYYDSMRNFLGSDVYQYIGQEFFLNGQMEGMRKYGYGGFYTTDGCGLYGEDDYFENTYKPDETERWRSSYDQLVGKYFKVIEVVKHPHVKLYIGLKESLEAIKTLKGKESDKDKKQIADINKNIKKIKDDIYYDDKCFIKLMEKGSNDIVYYEYDRNSKYYYEFPFIVVGYFEKQKQLLIGQEFVIPDNLINGALDINTGKSITNSTGQTWKCVDLTIENKDYQICPIIQDSLGDKIIVHNFFSWVGIYIGGGYTIKEANNYKNKFGNIAFDSILQGKVYVGMSKEMCRLSIGKPQTIKMIKKSNREIENWIYYDQDLFFNKGDSTLIGKVNVGMTKDMCLQTLGKPEKIESIKKSGGKNMFCPEVEVWFYCNQELFFVFCKGVLSDINIKQLKSKKPTK